MSGSPAAPLTALARHYMLPEDRSHRILVFFILVNTFGQGMYLSAGLLYLTRSVGFPASQVGLALTVAGVLSLPAGVLIGRLSDRHGPRNLTMILLVVEGFAMLALTLVGNLAALLVVATVGAVGLQGSRTMRAVLIGRAGGGERVRLRSYMRAVSNFSMALGSAAGAVALQLDNRPGYLTVIVINGLTFFVSAAVLALLPAYPPVPAPPGAAPGRARVTGNRPFLAVTLLNAVMTLQYPVLTVALPLWISEHTDAPRAMVSAVLVVNTVLVVLLQVRVGQSVTDGRAAVRAMRTAGFVFLATSVAFSVTGHLSAWTASAVLLVAMAVHTFGELWHAAASFELAYGLAPEHAQGEYQGVFAFGVSGAMAVAPGLLTLLCLDWAPQGWYVLGGLLLLSGLLTGPAAAAAARRAGVADSSGTTKLLTS
ncbi:MFS transporter [Kineosporia sp. J2-2]|uniref:MFS transporter n=1 Tax=Kineosporia corallincola TaxID=2835133 RepID=A0ABS5TR25_9ACTN|nr:MFS transporter [Kineosporia corallincola]MBT0773324.1 MFS transporter [Kineosporia corallincola]